MVDVDSHFHCRGICGRWGWGRGLEKRFWVMFSKFWVPSRVSGGESGGGLRNKGFLWRRRDVSEEQRKR